MRIVIAPDSFKECLSAFDAACSIAEGARRVFPEAELELVPMADGGEGTVDALVQATGGAYAEAEVCGPLGDPVRARYGRLGDGRTAVIEMAAAAGLPLAPVERRDPLKATSRGVGELIRHAIDGGARRVILGIGGSATNDGGAGMAQALGFSLRDADDEELPPGGAALARLARIEVSAVCPLPDQTEVLVACDVRNPLCGPEGASRVYGPQKGASPADVEILDAALRHFAGVVASQLGAEVLDIPGGGAAGGLGAGLVAFLGAELRPGVDLVAEACGLARRIEGSDLVITGEGRMDGQTVHGKTPIGVARLARNAGVPVLALAGSLGQGWRAVYEHGIDAAFSIVPGPASLAEACAAAPALLADTAEAAMRIWRSAGAGRSG